MAEPSLKRAKAPEWDKFNACDKLMTEVDEAEVNREGFRDTYTWFCGDNACNCRQSACPHYVIRHTLPYHPVFGKCTVFFEHSQLGIVMNPNVFTLSDYEKYDLYDSFKYYVVVNEGLVYDDFRPNDPDSEPSPDSDDDTDDEPDENPDEYVDSAEENDFYYGYVEMNENPGENPGENPDENPDENVDFDEEDDYDLEANEMWMDAPGFDGGWGWVRLFGDEPDVSFAIGA